MRRAMTYLDGDRLASLGESDVVVALERTALLDGSDHVAIRWGWVTAGWGVELCETKKARWNGQPQACSTIEVTPS